MPGSEQKQNTRRANLAKPEVTEVAILSLPAQRVKMPLMEASRYSKLDLKLLALLQILVLSVLKSKVYRQLWYRNLPNLPNLMPLARAL